MCVATAGGYARNIVPMALFDNNNYVNVLPCLTGHPGRLSVALALY
jgi:hypothetical protein